MLKNIHFQSRLRSLCISLVFAACLCGSLHAQTIALNWTAAVQPSGVVLAGYNVYRSAISQSEAGTVALNGGTPITGTTYVDTTCPAGTTCYYEVTAQATSGQQSAFSNEASATATAPANPNPPVLSSSAITITSVTLTVNGSNTTITSAWTNMNPTMTDYVLWNGNGSGAVLAAGNCLGLACSVSTTVPTANVGTTRLWVIDGTGQFALY